MGAVAQSLPRSPGRLPWFWEFLRDELAPYPGRSALVARMVTASTLMMILCMTFRIPYAAYAALFALTISRESLAGTVDAARGLVVGSVLGGAYVIVSAMLVLGNAMLRFLWVGATFFLVFYAISALSNYGASARFAYLTVIVIPLLDSHASQESKVESTLWAVGAIAMGSVVTLVLETVFAAFRGTDPLIEAISERLASVEELLAYYMDGRPLDAAAQSAIARLATVGTSRLRRMLQRAGYEPQHEQQMAAVVALVGRLVDLAANLPQFGSQVGDEEQQRIRKVARNITAIRIALTNGTVPNLTELTAAGDGPSSFPLLVEIEKTVSLLDGVFTGAHSLAAYTPAPSEDRGQASPLVPGALANPEHIKFALRGCLAASLCYIIYSALFWPGISTAVTTCLLTALSTIGASHQKQLLRFAGALIGGVVIGMGAQVFILPNIDSIGGFSVLFALVATAAAWIATSSTRLSYFGVQVGVAFYLINLGEFKIQTSLAVARDRVVGILLGLTMMWLAFDLLWSTPTAVQMKRALVSAIRLLAQLAREPVSQEQPAAIERTLALREMINAQFDKVRSLADGVLFEFGPSRQQDLALRECIRKWQPQLRTLFLMRIASLKYRLQLPGFELPEPVLLSLREYDNRSATLLDAVADWIEGAARPAQIPRASSGELEMSPGTKGAGPPPANILSLGTLLRGIDTLTNSVAEEIARSISDSAS
jgi:multidrug resistance protein MdtO